MVAETVMGYLSLNGEDPWWLTLGKILIYIAIGTVLLMKSLQRVPSGQIALKTRWGKVVVRKQDTYTLGWFGRPKRLKPAGPVVVHAGLFIGVPWMHNLLLTSDQTRLLELRPQNQMGPRGYILNQIWIANFRVIDVYTVLIRYQDIDAQIRSLCEEVICNLLEVGCKAEAMKTQLPMHRDILAGGAQLGVVIEEFRRVSNNIADNLILTQPKPAVMARVIQFPAHRKAKNQQRRLATARRKAPTGTLVA